MGTNYYLHETVCPIYGTDTFNVIHFAKLSIGRKPLFEASGSLNSVTEWKKFIKCTQQAIVDEYGNTVEPHEFWAMVEVLQEDPTLGDHSIFFNAMKGFKDPEGYDFYTVDFC